MPGSPCFRACSIRRISAGTSTACSGRHGRSAVIPTTPRTWCQETYARVLARPRLLRRGDEIGYLLKVLRNLHVSRHRAASVRPQEVTLEDRAEVGDARGRWEPEAALEVRTPLRGDRRSAAGLPRRHRRGGRARPVLRGGGEGRRREGVAVTTACTARERGWPRAPTGRRRGAGDRRTPSTSHAASARPSRASPRPSACTRSSPSRPHAARPPRRRRLLGLGGGLAARGGRRGRGARASSSARAVAPPSATPWPSPSARRPATRPPSTPRTPSASRRRSAACGSPTTTTASTRAGSRSARAPTTSTAAGR